MKPQSWGQSLHADTQEMAGLHREGLPLGLWPKTPRQTWALFLGPGFPPISWGCLSAQTPQRPLRFSSGPPSSPGRLKLQHLLKGLWHTGTTLPPKVLLSPQHPFGFRAGTPSI